MNIKTFTIIAIASFAVLSVTACGGKQKASIETEQTEETSKTEVIVSDNKLFINSDLYNMSEEKVIFNAHGRLDPDNPSFGTDHIDHYRTLFWSSFSCIYHLYETRLEYRKSYNDS